MAVRNKKKQQQREAGLISAQGKPPQHVGRWIPPTIATLGVLFILAFTVPFQAAFDAPTGAFDYSWMLLLHDAVATGRQFGKQIILPQGPLGFIGTSIYDPRTYGVLIAARSIIALAAFWSLWEIARKLVPNALLALPWMLVIILLIGASPDHFFPACAILLVMNYFVVHGRKLGRSALALIVVLAAASLIKVNQPFYAIAVVGVLTLDQILQRSRYFFIPAVTYLGALLLFYLAARQAPSSLGTFLWGWGQVALGHADAVGLPGPHTDAICFVALVVLLLALIARFEWKIRRLAGLLPLAGLAAVLLLIYKHSFMRQDIAHAPMGPMVVTAAAILYAPALWPLGGRVWRGSCLVLIAVSCVFLTSILSRYTGSSLLDYTVSAADRCAQNAGAAVADLTDPTRLHRKWDANRQRIREENPLPLDKIAGTVDVYPHRQDVVFAYDLRYEPRPVVSSLVATSTTLADVNARHLRGPTAPQTVLFDIELVDNNYPTMLDGQSLPELLTRYDVVDASGALLVLRRAAAPPHFRFTPMQKLTGKFNEAIPIPRAAGAPIWAHIRLRKRWPGRIYAALYKPAVLRIAVHTADGGENSYRLLPALAEQGFLLSPLLSTRADYARLAGKSWERDLAPAMIDAIKIVVDDGSQEASFDPEFEVELQRLEFEHQERK